MTDRPKIGPSPTRGRRRPVPRPGDLFEGEVEGLRSLNGNSTTLNDAAVGPVLGSPAYPGKVVHYQVRDDQHGPQFTLVGRRRPSSTA